MMSTTYTTLNNKIITHIGKSNVFDLGTQIKTFLDPGFNNFKFFGPNSQLLTTKASYPQLHQLDDSIELEVIHIIIVIYLNAYENDTYMLSCYTNAHQHSPSDLIQRLDKIRHSYIYMHKSIAMKVHKSLSQIEFYLAFVSLAFLNLKGHGCFLKARQLKMVVFLCLMLFTSKNILLQSTQRVLPYDGYLNITS